MARGVTGAVTRPVHGMVLAAEAMGNDISGGAKAMRWQCVQSYMAARTAIKRCALHIPPLSMCLAAFLLQSSSVNPW